MYWLLMFCAVQWWQQGASMPTPGYGFACVAVGNRVYAIGGARGIQDSVIPRRAVEAYDVMRDTWLTGFSPLPVPRWYVGGAELNGKIYVMGGTDGRVESRRVDRFDPVANRWDTVAQLPWPRSGLGACTYNGAIYAAGGFCNCGRESYQRSVARFVPEGGAGHWEIVDSLNTPRSGLGVAVANSRIYAVGGKFFSNLASAEYYVPDLWQNDARLMHEARSGLALVGYGNIIAAIGGMGARWPSASYELLNTASGGWYRSEQLHEARGFLGAAMVRNRVVVVGGWGMSGVLGTVEIDSMVGTGVEEPGEQNRLADRFGSGATIVTTHDLSIMAPDARLYDSRGTRTSLARMATPGLYFLRLRDGTTAKLTLVR